MANIIYDYYKELIFNPGVDLEAGDAIYKVALLSAVGGLPQSIASISAATDIMTSAEIASGNGYTTSGEYLSGMSVTQTGGIGTMDATDLTWATSTITARGALLYRVSDAVPISYYDFGENKISSNGDFTVQWNALGCMTVQTKA